MERSQTQTSNELLERGVQEVFPNKEYVLSLLQSDKKLSLYVGIDPTGPTLHIGHAIILKKMAEFQQMGHKVILLIGDFTATIGDPTDKAITRKKLTHEEVVENAKLYKEQASIFLQFDGSNPAEIKYNSEWLSKMNFFEVLELTSHMTVDQMLKRDMFDKRVKEGSPIYIHEFLYPLLQGYDSVAMDVDGEVGGNDQMFNMLTGRTLLKQIKNKEKFVVTTKLLEDATGKKMGKSEGNMITLQDSSIDMFGKVMSWTDGMILPGFELCTYRTNEEIEEFKNKLKTENPRDIKVQLAKDIVTIYHSKDEAERAEENFNNTFKVGNISEDTKEIGVQKGTLLVDVLLQEQIIDSKNEFRRLVLNGAVMNITDDSKITDPNTQVQVASDFKIGKRRFLKVFIQ